MTQQPTNDLKARLSEAYNYLRDNRFEPDKMKPDNIYDIILLLSALLTPSDSDVKEALDFIENRLSFCRRELHFIAQIHPDYPRFAQELEKMETIRAAIFGLVAQNKELSDLIIKHRCPHEIEG